jgi:ABC-type amino acid transport system permease subunit
MHVKWVSRNSKSDSRQKKAFSVPEEIRLSNVGLHFQKPQIHTGDVVFAVVLLKTRDLTFSAIHAKFLYASYLVSKIFINNKNA